LATGVCLIFVSVKLLINITTYSYILLSFWHHLHQKEEEKREETSKNKNAVARFRFNKHPQTSQTEEKKNTSVGSCLQTN